MCGRFAMHSSADELLEQVRTHYSPEVNGWDDSNVQERAEDQENASPQAGSSNSRVYQHGYRIANYNVAPRTRVPVLRQIEHYEGKLGPPQLESMVWGLVPGYMKQKPEYQNQLKTINARDDTIKSGTGMWQSIKGKRRGVIFIDGFYEWLKKGPSTKLPHFTKHKDGRMMALACLWDSVHFEDEEFPLHSFTIITTDSNKQLSFLHDRMPVILDTPEEIATWLDVSSEGFSSTLASMLKPYEGKLECYAVSTDVGNVKNNSADFIIPIAERKGSIATFFKSPAKSKASLAEAAKPSSAEGKSPSPSKRKRSPSPADAKPSVSTVDPKTVGNLETKAPLPLPDTDNGLSPDKKRKVDKTGKTGDVTLAKASNNQALDSFFKPAT